MLIGVAQTHDTHDKVLIVEIPSFFYTSVTHSTSDATFDIVQNIIINMIVWRLIILPFAEIICRS